MTQQTIRNLYFKSERGDSRARQRLDEFLYEASPAINKRLKNLEAAELSTKSSINATYFRDEILGTSYFPRSMKAIQDKTDMVLETLLTINRFYNSNVTVRSIRAQQKKTLESLRNRGVEIPKGKEKLFFEMLKNDLIHVYLEFDSDQIMETLEKAVNIDGALDKVKEIWQRWRNNEVMTYNAFEELDEWVKENERNSRTDNAKRRGENSK